MIGRYRKKPVVVEAVQWDGENTNEVLKFAPSSVSYSNLGGLHLKIHTLEGVMRAGVGWWIIKGVEGEFYPCKPDIFAATYEPEEAPTWAEDMDPDPEVEFLS